MLVSSVVASESGRLPLISIFEQGKQVLDPSYLGNSFTNCHEDLHTIL